MITITMSNYIFNTDTSVYSKLVYAAIKKYSNSEGVCFPSRNTLAQLCKISLSTLRKAVNSLVEAKVLEKEFRYRENRSQTSNLYTLAPFMISGDYYFKVRADIFELDLTEIETVVYMYLCSCANKDNECYPSINCIAASCGVSQTSVKCAIKKLCGKQLILKSNQFREDGGKRNNLYRLVSEEMQKDTELIPESEDEAVYDNAEADNSYDESNVNNEEPEAMKPEEITSEDCERLNPNINDQHTYICEAEKTNENAKVKVRSDIFDFKLPKNGIMVYLYIRKCNALKTGKFPSVEDIARNCNISKTKVKKILFKLRMSGILEETKRNPITPWSIQNLHHGQYRTPPIDIKSQPITITHN